MLQSARPLARHELLGTEGFRRVESNGACFHVARLRPIYHWTLICRVELIPHRLHSHNIDKDKCCNCSHKILRRDETPRGDSYVLQLVRVLILDPMHAKSWLYGGCSRLEGWAGR